MFSGTIMKLCLIVMLSTALSFQSPAITVQRRATALWAAGVINRGLEKKREGATPQEGGMVLYLKAAADGTSVGDCPFAHYVRMVLEEKNLEYEIRPTVQETKPSWLIEHYGGKLPALRHRKECYVESDVICEYLDFFFQNPPLTVSSKAVKAKAEAAVEGLFPAVAKYLKHIPDGDDDDQILQNNLENTLSKLNNHLQETGPFLCGEEFSLMDCALAPKLYHMKTGVSFFKDSSITLDTKFPEISNYMQTVFSRKSFVDTKYPEEVIVWGWGNARK